MSTARRATVQPIIIERRPDSTNQRSAIAPATPPSPKAVRFALESTSSRPLSPTESWSLYHFECHARTCRECYNPYDVYRKGHQLCTQGHALAQDVAIHVYYKEGDIYGQSDKLVRVELPHKYDQARSLLKGMDHYLNRRRTSPVISYDKAYPIQRRASPQRKEAKSDVVIEPGRSDRKDKRADVQKPKQKSKYRTIVIQDDNDDSESQRPAKRGDDDEQRGSLYRKDQERRRREAYRVEVREPDQKDSSQGRRRRQPEERRSAYYS
ncbi:hypothetical protein K431DRAFT_234497 [Polychaeton citri CBS 116435]|uniref:Uncharacterized protein n=1 Tax=Polychaeton citri CBS 116435 TaxID=1314669 RepID=A0A9P4UJX5_9PEZI|nr:hypothetical protein K431DRAFT_234497 [Polychaeton citri CBS 116435]